MTSTISRKKKKVVAKRRPKGSVVKPEVQGIKKISTWAEVEAQEPTHATREFEAPPSKYQKAYPAPIDDPIFVIKWNQFIDDVAMRDNFKVGHLSQLRILCDLYVEYDYLSRKLRINGYTFESDGGRNGVQVKPYPEVAQLNICRKEIAYFSRVMGLLLMKDSTLTEDKHGEEGQDEW